MKELHTDKKIHLDGYQDEDGNHIFLPDSLEDEENMSETDLLKAKLNASQADINDLNHSNMEKELLLNLGEIISDDNKRKIEQLKEDKEVLKEVFNTVKIDEVELEATLTEKINDTDEMQGKKRLQRLKELEYIDIINSEDVALIFNITERSQATYRKRSVKPLPSIGGGKGGTISYSKKDVAEWNIKYKNMKK